MAYQGDAELGAKFADGIARIALEAAYASGDDPSTTDKNESWFDGFSTAHKWLGLMDVFGLRSNVFAGTLHGSVKATDSGKIGLQAHALMRPQQLNAAGTDGEFKFVGGEIDIYGVYNIAKGLSLRPDYGVFIPTTDGYGAGSDAAHMLMIQLQYKGG